MRIIPVVEFGILDPKDTPAQDLFDRYREEYHLDEGGLDERYNAAKRMTDDLFSGTPYFVKVEEYCCFCTVTSLFKRVFD